MQLVVWATADSISRVCMCVFVFLLLEVGSCMAAIGVEC